MASHFLKNNYVLDGWKFEIFIDKKKYNVNQEIKNYLDQNNTLEIKKGFDIKNLAIKKYINYKKCYLKITNKLNKFWTPITIKENTPFKLYLGEIENKVNIEIVYFFNANISSSYLKLFNDQIKDLIKSKILEKQDTKLFFIIICSDNIKREKILKIIKKLENKIFCKHQVLFSTNENKEYEGINKVWELAKNDKKEKFILYFHGKGISYIQNKFFYIRQPLEKFIFKYLIFKWKTNIEILSRFKSIYKIGILSGGNGWLWFNFWIAKSSYIFNLEQPKKRNRACYYEDWLGRYIINKKQNSEDQYTNEFNESFLDTINNTMSILYSTKKNKFNLGTNCKVEKGGFVGLGFIKITYRIWYWFYVLLNKLSLNRSNKNRFKFF